MAIQALLGVPMRAMLRHAAQSPLSDAFVVLKLQVSDLGCQTKAQQPCRNTCPSNRAHSHCVCVCKGAVRRGPAHSAVPSMQVSAMI